jgi:hypothetical protein
MSDARGEANNLARLGDDRKAGNVILRYSEGSCR